MHRRSRQTDGWTNGQAPRTEEAGQETQLQCSFLRSAFEEAGRLEHTKEGLSPTGRWADRQTSCNMMRQADRQQRDVSGG
jgi:hypothetical protein